MECVLQEKALPQSSSVADEKMPTTKVKAKPKEKKSTKRAAEGETMADDGAKKAKGAADSHRLVSSEESTHWKLGDDSKKRLVLQKWKGKAQIHIREYYEKEGDWKPGSKGLALSVESFNNLKSIIASGEIDTEIENMMRKK